MQALEEFLDVRQPELVVLVSKTEQLARIYEAYLRRESGRMERLGYSLDPAVKAAPERSLIQANRGNPRLIERSKRERDAVPRLEFIRERAPTISLRAAVEHGPCPARATNGGPRT